MARKKDQHKNGFDRKPSINKEKDSASERGLPVFNETGKSNVIKEAQHGDEQCTPLTEEVKGTFSSGNGRRRIKRFGKSQRTEQGTDAKQRIQEPLLDKDKPGHSMETSPAQEIGKSESVHASEHTTGSPNNAQERLQTEDVSGLLQLSDILGLESLKISVLSILKTSYEWIGKQRPLFLAVTNRIQNSCDYIRMKYVQAYPIVLRWLGHCANILLLVSMVWLDCFLRGLDSFMRMGTTSFFSVIWCSVLSVIAMVGMFKFLLVLAAAALVGIFVGFVVAVLVCAASGAVILWLYGSFWTTSFVIALAGLSFALTHERLALLLTTVYSVYCVWTYVGWFGILVGLNLSFVSSDVLVYFLKSNMDGNMSSGQTTGAQSQQSFFSGESYNSYSEKGQGEPADRSAGIASTSGADSEITSEDEVVRLLNCADHYSAMGLSRYEHIDVSVLKREYRKKAMLVHPDKNMGNEKAAEAFKKLQNAYEVLLDSLKRKAYDDELRREELLNYFRQFRSIPQKKGRHGFFPNGFARSEGDSEDPLGEARRIACKKCGDSHVWIQTKKSKSRARWCQECKGYHQAKDGDGWVEQSSQPFFFGMLQKVDAPAAYVCADSRVYDATEWYICQGMRCPANSHKPSFHVNTNLTKHNHGKGPSSQRGGIPASNMEENMTEEEFFEWLQNAVNSGIFDNFAGGSSTSGDGTPTGSVRKSAGPSSSSSSSSKKKKRGKKQW